jgi:hypothetical protein
MKNKYYFQNKKEARLTKLNHWVMNEFCFPLKIPKILFNKVKKYLINRKYKFVGHKLVYQSLEVNECMFKDLSNKIIIR